MFIVLSVLKQKNLSLIKAGKNIFKNLCYYAQIMHNISKRKILSCRLIMAGNYLSNFSLYQAKFFLNLSRELRTIVLLQMN